MFKRFFDWLFNEEKLVAVVTAKHENDLYDLYRYVDRVTYACYETYRGKRTVYVSFILDDGTNLSAYITDGELYEWTMGKDIAMIPSYNAVKSGTPCAKFSMKQELRTTYDIKSGQVLCTIVPSQSLHSI